MGFWSTVGKLAKDGMETLKETNEEVLRLKEAYGGYSDEELKAIVKSDARYAKKAAAAALLKERGYGGG
jgi:hypothetical protein